MSEPTIHQITISSDYGSYPLPCYSNSELEVTNIVLDGKFTDLQVSKLPESIKHLDIQSRDADPEWARESDSLVNLVSLNLPADMTLIGDFPLLYVDGEDHETLYMQNQQTTYPLANLPHLQKICLYCDLGSSYSDDFSWRISPEWSTIISQSAFFFQVRDRITGITWSYQDQETDDRKLVFTIQLRP